MTAEIPASVYEDAARAALGVSHDKADQYAMKMQALNPAHRATVEAGYLAGRLHAAVEIAQAANVPGSVAGDSYRKARDIIDETAKAAERG